MEDEAVAYNILPVIDNPYLAAKTQWKVTKLCGRLLEEKQLDLS